MKLQFKQLSFVLTLLLSCLCGFLTVLSESAQALPAAETSERWLARLQGKSVALVVNQTSRVGQQHLVDFLLQHQIKVKRVFAPEHGFRGEADAGAHLQDGMDPQTGLPIVSLYGKQKKPGVEHLADIDIIVFDIQDIGVRYYTYISTLHYVMEAAAEQHKQLMILDRPNPNGDSIDGPILEPAYRSFVGLHPIPLVHGLTIAELAQMIKGEHWIEQSDQLDLSLVTMADYRHSDIYSLPVRPSPNLRSDLAIRLYPSLGLFEGTLVSVGRGTERPFEVIGWSHPQAGPFQFSPQAVPGAMNPPYLNQTCYGWDLRAESGSELARFNLKYLLRAYQSYRGTQDFFNPFFEKLAGTASLRQQIEAGWDESQIRASWQKSLDAYREMRKKYLLYP